MVGDVMFDGFGHVAGLCYLGQDGFTNVGFTNVGSMASAVAVMG